MFLPLDIRPAPLAAFTYICHCCDTEEHRPLPMLPGNWSAARIDGIECALCPDCTATAQHAMQPEPAMLVDAAGAPADTTAALERQIELGRKFLDRGMPILFRTIVVLLGTGLAAQLGKLGGIL